MARQVMNVDDTATNAEPTKNTVAEIQAKLAETLADDGVSENVGDSDRPLLRSGPLAALKGSPLRTSPLERIAKTAESVERVKKLEQQLSAGQAVVELNPDDIDASFVPDRMAPSDEDHRKLVDAIRSEGQLVPILVRPHPEKHGRYQIAYGHRRHRAIKELGITIRAVVRELSDEQLVVAQGQENNERTNLSFIEKARFASRLQERGFKREIIMQALSTDKGTLSKLLSTIGSIPADVVEAIGPAPGIGTRRWQEFAEKLSRRLHDKIREAIASPGFFDRDSDARFEVLLKLLGTKEERARAEPWIASNGIRVAQVTRSSDKFSLVIDHKVAPEFGDFLLSRMESLFSEFQGATKAE
jgi:ParB family transcriptional regulator, chromosome partitioning protein